MKIPLSGVFELLGNVLSSIKKKGLSDANAPHIPSMSPPAIAVSLVGAGDFHFSMLAILTGMYL